MLKTAQSRPDLLLLLSLLLIILIYPVLDHGDVRRAILGVLMFLPITMAVLRLSAIKSWVWPSVVLMSIAIVASIAGNAYPHPYIIGTKWAVLTLFFGLTVAGLFPYIRNARSVTDSHLYTAISIYLLLGMQWFTLYAAIDRFFPGSILLNNSAGIDRSSELLYFSLVTLSTIGYGDIVPLSGEVRMLAALEGVTGVLYVAITIALLVSAYKAGNASDTHS
jgi:hypothetical protein